MRYDTQTMAVRRTRPLCPHADGWMAKRATGHETNDARREGDQRRRRRRSVLQHIAYRSGALMFTVFYSSAPFERALATQNTIIL